MKTIILFITSMALIFSISAQTDHFTVRVDGLGCPFCAYGLEKKFSEVEGIENIEVNLKEGVLTYDVPASLKMDFATVNKLIDDAGYTTIFVEVKRADGESKRLEKGDGDGNSNNSSATEASFTVHGNCGMCKDRIEKAANSVRGVKSAKWDDGVQKLEVVFDSEQVKTERIHRAVAGAGHDTEEVRARDRVFNNLPECCKYDRPAN